MSRSPEVREIDISVCVDDLLGPLGYGDGDAVQPAIMEQIVAETAACRQMMTGKAIYTWAEIERPDGVSGMGVDGVPIEDETLVDSLDGARFLAVGVCTVGSEIEKVIDEHFRGGEYLRGMIADIAASRATEDVAHTCAALICGEARKLDLSASGRLSPGYGKWDVSGQRALFALLDPSPIGVSLNEHCMMHPRKSASFVFPLVEGEPPRRALDPCRECGFQNCSYRRK